MEKVTLNCTNETTGENYQLPRNVELIQNCSCVDCNDNSIRQHVESNEDGNDTLVRLTRKLVGQEI